MGASHVRLVELTGSNTHSLCLERYACAPLPPDAIIDGDIDNLEQVVAAVQALWEKSGCHAKQVAIAVPPGLCITKKLVLPAGLDAAQLGSQVEAAADQYLPFSLAEVNIDFHVIGPTQQGADTVEVLLVAVRKEKIEDRIAVIEALGATPIVVDIETYAAQTALLRTYRANTTATSIILCQINTQCIHLSLLVAEQVVYEREHALGPLRANVEDSVTENETSSEMMRALHLLLTAAPYHLIEHPIEQIFLSGERVLSVELCEAITHHMHIATAIVNPFANMQLAPALLNKKQMVNEAPAYLIACGLALRACFYK